MLGKLEERRVLLYSARGLMELGLVIIWKSELGYLAEKILGQNVVAWLGCFLLITVKFKRE